MSTPGRQDPTPASPLQDLRDEVRQFLRDEQEAGSFVPAVDAWLTGWDESFSRKIAARGWLGMTIPEQYGGHGRSYQERFVVTEELLAAGAPVAAHWVADRQIAPSLLRFGSELQRSTYLPAIARGECWFAIGMSEPDSGSDLASVRTRAHEAEGGWRLTGTKVWTSGAHRAHAFFVLARTSPRDDSDRHGGLSQFIVDLQAPGVTVNPITSMDGRHHFNEVVLDDVFVPDEWVLGAVGDGWAQVTAELAYERSGPERFLSTFPLLTEALVTSRGSAQAPAEHRRLARHAARVAALHAMSEAVADALQAGEQANLAAAVVKVCGTKVEGDIVESLDQLRGTGSGAPARLTQLLESGLLQRPGFTLRGGTNEILRGVIAREMGLR